MRQPSKSLAPSTPFSEVFLALRGGSIERAREFIERGVDMNATDASGHTLLYWATAMSDTSIAQVLLQRGARPDDYDKHHQTPLHKAAMKGNKEMARVLLEWEASLDMVDIFGRSALHWACANGHEGVACLLVDHGCDTGIMDKSGLTAADVASFKNFIVIADYVRRHGKVTGTARFRAVIRPKTTAAASNQGGSQSTSVSGSTKTTPRGALTSNTATHSETSANTLVSAMRTPRGGAGDKERSPKQVTMKLDAKSPRERKLLWEEVVHPDTLSSSKVFSRESSAEEASDDDRSPPRLPAI